MCIAKCKIKMAIGSLVGDILNEVKLPRVINLPGHYNYLCTLYVHHTLPSETKAW